MTNKVYDAETVEAAKESINDLFGNIINYRASVGDDDAIQLAEDWNSAAIEALSALPTRNDAGREEWELIEKLRAKEGYMVTIAFDNPDWGAPKGRNCQVQHSKNYGESFTSFYADSVLEALQAALSHTNSNAFRKDNGDKDRENPVEAPTHTNSKEG